MTDVELWWITLIAGTAVSLVVWLLLALIASLARGLGRTVDEIRVFGQSAANNMLHADLLRRHSVVAEDILASLKLSSMYARHLRALD